MLGKIPGFCIKTFAILNTFTTKAREKTLDCLFSYVFACCITKQSIFQSLIQGHRAEESQGTRQGTHWMEYQFIPDLLIFSSNYNSNNIVWWLRVAGWMY